MKFLRGELENAEGFNGRSGGNHEPLPMTCIRREVKLRILQFRGSSRRLAWISWRGGNAEFKA
jgi:hypothetical protein